MSRSKPRQVTVYLSSANEWQSVTLAELARWVPVGLRLEATPREPGQSERMIVLRAGGGIIDGVHQVAEFLAWADRQRVDPASVPIRVLAVTEPQTGMLYDEPPERVQAWLPGLSGRSPLVLTAPPARKTRRKAVAAPAAATSWISGGTPVDEFVTWLKPYVAATPGPFRGELDADRKVFISDVWDRIPPRQHTLTLDSFKELLVAAHRAGLLSLTRADLAPAFAPEPMRRSETRYFGATFHFIRVDSL